MIVLTKTFIVFKVFMIVLDKTSVNASNIYKIATTHWNNNRFWYNRRCSDIVKCFIFGSVNTFFIIKIMRFLRCWT